MEIILDFCVVPFTTVYGHCKWVWICLSSSDIKILCVQYVSTFQNIIENKSSDIVKVINDDISIRTGKFGKYIYYKTSTMSKPVFLGFKKYKLKLTSSISDIENAIEQYYN